MNIVNTFFSGAYFTSSAYKYSGYGLPEDRVGDGIIDTVFYMSDTFIVDGIRAPRATSIFPNGEADPFDPTGVGALWDPVYPIKFPDPLL